MRPQFLIASASCAAALALAVTPASAQTAHSPAAGCQTSSEANTRIVLDFYRQALLERQPRAAFERYVSPDFVEHKPDVEQGSRAAVILFLEGLMDELPEARWEIVRTVSQDDFVVIHARFTPAPGAGSYAIADFFRLENCLIVEHWDVVASPPADPRNPNSRF